MLVLRTPSEELAVETISQEQNLGRLNRFKNSD